jgi:hypothetical protein
MLLYISISIDKLDELSGSYLIEWTNNNLTNKIYIKCKPPKIENIKNRLNILIKVINRIQIKSKKKLGIELYLVLSDLKKIKSLNKKAIIKPRRIVSRYQKITPSTNALNHFII